MPVPTPTALPTELLISHRLAPLLMSAASPLPGMLDGMPTQLAEATCTGPPVQDSNPRPVTRAQAASPHGLPQESEKTQAKPPRTVAG